MEAVLLILTRLTFKRKTQMEPMKSQTHNILLLEPHLSSGAETYLQLLGRWGGGEVGGGGFWRWRDNIRKAGAEAFILRSGFTYHIHTHTHTQPEDTQTE